MSRLPEIRCRLCCTILLAAVLPACSTLPAFGPSSESIVDAATIEESEVAATANYRLVDITESTVPVKHDKRPQLFSNDLTSQTLLSNNQSVSPGDTIVIRVWEAADDGLFASSGQRETTFTLTVSNSGQIDVPYAGTIDVLEKTERQIRKTLLARYKGKAIDPEIIVQIQSSASRGVSVLGAVAVPGRITIPAQGMRLLDLLAMAGSVPHSEWEYTVIITRKGRKERLGLDRVLLNAKNNVVLLPGDAVQVEHLPRKFPVYGAITKPGNKVITSPYPRLSDLLAESGGLNDMQAEASSVFVFRPSSDPTVQGDEEATVYRLNFSRPDAFILSRRFEVDTADIVYVATAGASEFRKFVITLLSPFLGSAGSAQGLGN